MASFNMERCSEHTQQLIFERYPLLEDQVRALDLQVNIGTAFSCNESPSIDPAAPMLPAALRLLADSLEHELTQMQMDENALGSACGD